MEARFASLTSDGLLALPADAQSALGLHPGSRLAITFEADRIILQPVDSDELDELCGILAGGPDLVEELQRERRKDNW